MTDAAFAFECLAEAAYRATPRATGQQWDDDEQTRRKYRAVARAVVLALAEDDEHLIDAAGWAAMRNSDPDIRDLVTRRRALIAEARGAAPDPS